MFRRRRVQRLRKFFIKVFVEIFAAILVIGFLLILWKLRVLNVKSVIVEGCEATSCNDVASQIEKMVSNKPIFFVSVSKIKQDVLKTGRYSSVIVEKVLPSTIKIRMKEVAVSVCLYNGAQEVQLDESGNKVNIYSKCPEETDRFKYSVNNLETVNSFDVYQIETARLIKNYLLSNSMSLKELELKPYGVIEARFSSDLVGVFSTKSDRDINSQLSVFYKVYSFIVKEGRHVISIDVRFDKIVVKYAE